MKSSIHPTAIVESGAQLGEGCVIHAGAIIRSGAILGDKVAVHPYAVVGGDPQVLRFDPSVKTGTKVGAGTIIREYVTINRSTEPGAFTEVGSNCLLMACSHVAHDTLVGNNVVVANAVLLAGHIVVGNNVVLGGGSAYHQFSRIGEGSMVGGLARITQDIPPYVMIAERNEVSGLNLVGLRRRGATREAINELKEAFRLVYFQTGNIREIAAKAIADGTFKAAEPLRFLEFITQGKRGIARARRKGELPEEDAG
jgi:UDP-N-acetylglucosamine acyltransferase